MLEAVVLAGSKNSGSLGECGGETNEAMIRIAKKPMIQYVVEALAASKYVTKIIIVGPLEIGNVFTDHLIEIVEPVGTVMENLVAGLAKTCSINPVLVVTADLPLLTAEAVDNLIELCRDSKVDFYYPIVPMDRIEQSFPGVHRTAVKTKEGLFTGGNVFIVNPSVVPGIAGKVQEFVNYRKSPFHLCLILGVKFVLKFLANRLTIPELEEKISETFSISAKAVITMYPEIGFDVDKSSDYNIVSTYLGKSA